MEDKSITQYGRKLFSMFKVEKNAPISWEVHSWGGWWILGRLCAILVCTLAYFRYEERLSVS